MKKLLMGTVAALSLGVFATSSHAADLMDYPVASGYDWTGWYVGANAGYAFGDYSTFDLTFATGPNVEVDGFIGGVGGGYNWQIGSTVFGIEVDVSNGPNGTTAQGTSFGGTSCGSGACNTDIEYFATVRGRLGYAHDNLLAFLTAGVAFGEVSGGIRNSAQQGGGFANGWVGGGGFEYGISESLSIKVEYLHVDLGDIPYGSGSGGPTTPFVGRGDFDVVRGGVNFHF